MNASIQSAFRPAGGTLASTSSGQYVVNGACTGTLPTGAAYANGGTGYTLSNAPAGTSLTASGLSSGTPAANTCQFVCTGGYTFNPSINKCESVLTTATHQIGSDDAGG